MYVRGHFDSRAGSARPHLIELSRPPTRGPFPPSPRTSGLRGLRSGCGRTSSVLQLRVATGLRSQGWERRATARFGWSSPVRNLPFGVGSVGRAGDPPAGLCPVGGVPHLPPHSVPPLRGWKAAGEGCGRQGLRPRTFGNSALPSLLPPSSRPLLLSHSHSSVCVCSGGGSPRRDVIRHFPPFIVVH